MTFVIRLCPLFFVKQVCLMGHVRRQVLPCCPLVRVRVRVAHTLTMIYILKGAPSTELHTDPQFIRSAGGQANATLMNVPSGSVRGETMETQEHTTYRM